MNTETFQVKEYELLKLEITKLQEHSRTIEFYAIGALGVFYAWLFDQCHIDCAILNLPVVLLLFAGCRAWAVETRIADIGNYLFQVEEELKTGASALKGWEHWRRNIAEAKSSRRRLVWKAFLRTTSFYYWLFLILAALLVAWIPYIFEF